MLSDAMPLIVIGGGPKAAALAAKSRVLRDHGIAAPPVFVVESKKIAANWCGEFGFTSGDQRLGTPPEKDVGFPYVEDPYNSDITRDLFSRYSWTSYVIFNNIFKSDFGEWIDRGRPHPTHKEWANYIEYVIKQSADQIFIGSAHSIKQYGEHWTVQITRNGQTSSYEACGIVITGPGDRKVITAPGDRPGDRRVPISIPSHPHIFYGDDFWTNLDRLEYLISGDDFDALPVFVVGGGETSASITSYLIDRFGSRRLQILVLTRSGTIFSRGEGYYENRMFTEFQTWKSLPSRVRREVITRGDRGVFSAEIARKLAYAHNVDHQFLEVKKVRVAKNGSIIVNDLQECQMLIFGLGFDPFSFSKMFDVSLSGVLSSPTEQSSIEDNINYDLSVSHPDFTAKLYLPMISAFAQGPGFPNLSCLGTLSDRILGRDR